MGWFCCFMFGSDDSISNLLGVLRPSIYIARRDDSYMVSIESLTKFMMKLSQLSSCI
jgi:hypothetical protein